jgi:hypothetical protein
MADDERERTGPTAEVGDEGGGPGELELKRIAPVVTGSESTSTVLPAPTKSEERDRQKTRES